MQSLKIPMEYYSLLTYYKSEESHLFLKAIRVGDEQYISNELEKSYIKEDPQLQIIAVGTAIVANRMRVFNLFLKHQFKVNRRKSIYDNFPMIAAIDKNDIHYIQSLLEYGANPNFQVQKQFLIHYSQGQNITRLLLEHKALYSLEQLYLTAINEQNFPDKERIVPPINEIFGSLLPPSIDILTFASKMGDVQVVKILLDKGLNINDRDSLGETALQSSILANQVDVFRFLIENGADRSRPFPESIHNKNGIFPIHLCAQKGCIELSKLLIDAGEDVNRKDQLGNTPLYHAVKKNKGLMSTYLIEKGADIYSENLSGQKIVDLPIKDIALLKLFRQLVKEADKGQLTIDPDNHILIYEMLSYIDPIKNFNDQFGNPTLFKAIFKHDYSQVRALLASGCSPNQVNDLGISALFYASSLGYLDCVKSLVLSGADINHKSDAEFTPLSAAVLSNQKEIIEYLIQQGANPNIPNIKGETPLYFPMVIQVINNEFDILSYLLKHGALPHLKIAQNQTVFQLAIKDLTAKGNFQRLNQLKSMFLNKETDDSQKPMTVLHDILEGLFMKISGNIMVECHGLIELKHLFYFNELVLQQDLSARYKQQIYYEVTEASKQLVQLTIEDKSLLDRQDSQGNTPVHLAVIYGNSHSLEHLLIQGANPNILNHDGLTPLHLVLKQDVFKPIIVEKLKTLEPNEEYFPDEEAVDSWFPLPERQRIFELLIEYQANKHIKDQYGRTALDLAKITGYNDAIKCLS